MKSSVALWTCCLAFLLACAGRETIGHTPWFGQPPQADVVNIQMPSKIKVSLLNSRRAISIGCTGPCSYVDSKKGKQVSLGSKTRLKIQGGKGGLTIDKKTVSTSIQVSPTNPDTYVTLNGRPYRGTLWIRSRGKGVVNVIEQVDLEEYLNGVLPREVGVDWPVESLKAQAVVSRTYVLTGMGASRDKGYDVSSDVFSQVYGGLQDENPATNAAVRATRGEILIDEKGDPVLSFFHSSCGGRTESPQYVWQDLKNPPSYFVSVKDPFCKDDPFSEWRFEISAESLQKRLKRVGYRGGVPRDLRIATTSPSGRAAAFIVESSKGEARIPGNKFRLAVGANHLRSTLLTKLKRRGKSFLFEGHGWGHGVGLCQWGARGRALEGDSYQKILQAYYPNVRLVKAAGTKE